MPEKLLHAIAPGTRLRIVNALKRTQGMTVKELGAQLGMSYMGVKGMCEELQRRGLIEGWREPRPSNAAGRPRLVYRLTDRTHELYTVASTSLTHELLEAARKLHGPAAPEKLLLTVWHDKVVSLGSRLTGDTVTERAECLARLRESDGHMASVVETGRIVEHHCPYLDILKAYPLVAKLETDLFAKLLGVPVRREEHQAGGQYRVEIWFDLTIAPANRPAAR
jgi:predicted ArsR family transcriptional regulator